MRRIAALCAVALVVMAATATSALAAEGGAKGLPLKSAAALAICEKSGGTFVDVSPLVYACVFPNNSTPQNRKKAAKICKSLGGTFVDVSPLVYACVLPGGTLPGTGGLPIPDTGGLPIPDTGGLPIPDTGGLPSPAS